MTPVFRNWLVKDKFQTLWHGVRSPSEDHSDISLDSQLFPLLLNFLVVDNVDATIKSACSFCLQPLTSRCKSVTAKTPDLTSRSPLQVSPSRSLGTKWDFYQRFLLYMAFFPSLTSSLKQRNKETKNNNQKKKHLNIISHPRMHRLILCSGLITIAQAFSCFFAFADTVSSNQDAFHPSLSSRTVITE